MNSSLSRSCNTASVLPSRPSGAHLRAGTWALVATALLAGCGGGGSGGDDTPPVDGGTPAPVITAGVPGLVGEWVQQGCVATGTQGFKRLLTARQTAANTITYSEGVLSFGNRECAGTSTQAGPSALGSVVFDRSESNSTVAANWGTFSTVTGTRFAVIWAKRGEQLLCLLGDQNPSLQPTLGNVAQSLATVPTANCFAPR